MIHKLINFNNLIVKYDEINNLNSMIFYPLIGGEKSEFFLKKKLFLDFLVLTGTCWLAHEGNMIREDHALLVQPFLISVYVQLHARLASPLAAAHRGLPLLLLSCAWSASIGVPTLVGFYHSSLNSRLWVSLSYVFRQ